MRRPLVLCAAAALSSSALVLLPGAAAADPLPADCSQAGRTVTCTYGFTGGEQTFDVPAGVTMIGVTATGGSGGSGSGGSAPGAGATVTADLPATPSQPLYVEVGGGATKRTGQCFADIACVGGFNGGGTGGEPGTLGQGGDGDVFGNDSGGGLYGGGAGGRPPSVNVDFPGCRWGWGRFEPGSGRRHCDAGRGHR